MEGVKIVTIGGGSSYTPELIEGFIKRYQSLPVREIWLVDIEEGREKLETVGNLAKRMVKKSGLPIAIHLTLDRREALAGADFVTTQIRVGQLKARGLDEQIPLKHGLLGQETNGAGGMFKAFRTIPVILEITKDMKELCPEAWLINFSNPAGMVTEACLRYGQIKKVIGLCNVPIHMEMDIAKLLEVPKEDVWVRFGGLNHLVYALQIFLKGKDVTGQVLELSTDPEKGMAMTMKNIMPVSYEREFIRALGVLPCPYHSYYYRKDEQLKEELVQLKEGAVRALKVQEIEKELFALYQNEDLDIKPPQLEQRGGAYYSDAACSLIESIYTDKRDIQTVDTRNNGTIAGIPDDSAIECSCIITGEGPVPLNIGHLPVAVNGLVQEIKSFERMTVEAAVTGDRDKALLALSINPLTTSDKVAKAVIEELMEAHKDYLPQFNR
ncbi:6-phospho-beta-glucosidase [Lachnospiraceae bacterium PF1-21]|uniref:6-phospho-beta-glucosidase n=1 Tax=Ohessyouella blattaphilus TaxID=2949333 RepID=A0ABT1EJY8_9FIRM|nr:6-phospho-beta-glucosidase [Ohessyouella blattaphilus]MCP1110856.1 6-phospho-beta-glucosidase [Ohessyouella blattaphilus]MCR8564250.1 6-phospho-beta-glucosidase [Ohessyouella blattaphilus]